MPVPPSTTLCRTDVVVSADSRVTARLVFCSGRSAFSPSLVTSVTRVYVARLPWLARVAYASVMSRTLGVDGPSAIEGDSVRSGVSLGRPRSIAVCLTLSEPTSTAICAYTALTDLSVASRTVMGP